MDGNCAFLLSVIQGQCSEQQYLSRDFAAWGGSRDSDPQAWLTIAPVNKPLLFACFCYYLESTRAPKHMCTLSSLSFSLLGF